MKRNVLTAITMFFSLGIFLFSQVAFAERSADEAVAWAEGQVGSNADECNYNDAHKWAYQCMHFCGHAYGIIPSGVLTAKIGWTGSDNVFSERHTSRDFKAIPEGALVFFDIYETGHVGLSIGNGQMIHAWTDGVIKSNISDSSYSDNYLGWRWPATWTDDTPNPDTIILPYRLVGNVAWYPSNKSCINAERWIFYNFGYPNGGMSVNSNDICYQEEQHMTMVLGGTESKNWWYVIYSPDDIKEICQ